MAQRTAMRRGAVPRRCVRRYEVPYMGRPRSLTIVTGAEKIAGSGKSCPAETGSMGKYCRPGAAPARVGGLIPNFRPPICMRCVSFAFPDSITPNWPSPRRIPTRWHRICFIKKRACEVPLATGHNERCCRDLAPRKGKPSETAGRKTSGLKLKRRVRAAELPKGDRHAADTRHHASEYHLPASQPPRYRHAILFGRKPNDTPSM